MSMSLGRLLTCGRSLVGLRSSESRYQMRRKNLLPKFGSQSNPFVTTRPEPLAAAAGQKFQAVGRTLITDPAPSPMCSAPLVQAIKDPGGDTKQAAGSIGKLRATWAGLVRVLFLKSWFHRRKPSKAARPERGFQNGQMQGELSLESIKVVRNDLSEADIAIVPVRTALAPRVEPAAPSGPVGETAELIKT